MRVRDFFGDEITPLDVLAFNTSLILVNAHFSLNEPKPTVPGIVEIGGLHIGPLLPLPTVFNGTVTATVIIKMFYCRISKSCYRIPKDLYISVWGVCFE